MNFSRREALGLGAAVGGAALLGGCAKIDQRIGAMADPSRQRSLDLPAGSPHPTVRLLNRAAFGPCPGDVAAVAGEGHEAYVDRQLHPDDGDESLSLKLQIGGIEALHEHGSELEDEPQEELLRQLQQATLLRAIYSRNQLRERMADLWTNHFNIYARKNDEYNQKPGDDTHVIRPHVLDTFPNLLKATAHSPAMLAFLDNQINRKGTANENYARELMELHTLGVHGGYTQKDVQEVARCFTGWGVEDRFFRPLSEMGAAVGDFRYDDDLHDRGRKVVLGHVIPAGGGQSDGETVLDILAGHPATARFIASKICRYFLGSTDGPWVDRLASIYRRTGGDLKPMLRPMLLSDDLTSGPPIAKRPLDFVASALRAVDAQSDCLDGLQRQLEKMGQPLYQWPMPDGFPEKAAAWTGSLLARWNFAYALCSGNLGGASLDLTGLYEKTAGSPIEAAMALVLGRAPVAGDALPRTLKKAQQDPVKLTALCLASPEFQWK